MRQPGPSAPAGILVGTPAYNDHIQQIALALYEAGALGMYALTGVDSFHSAPASWIRSLAAKMSPAADRMLRRRRITSVPPALVESDWTWDFWRSLVHSTGGSEILKDWLWERSELHLDRKCAGLLSWKAFSGFIGTEFGCLASLQAARQAGITGTVVYMSPHHSAYERWVKPEFQKFPELNIPHAQHMQKLAPARDARKDSEAQIADLLVSNSGFTTRTLVEAGFERNRIITVPLACAPVSEVSLIRESVDRPLRFMYAGPVSVRKGAHILLEAWRIAAPGSRHAELHLYGTPALPASLLSDLPENVTLHGSIARDKLNEAYQQSDVLLFPTLLDGFGLVVTEALANGLPVITTMNAGAADLVCDGYNGFVLEPNDRAALTERIHWCLDNRKILAGMRPNCLAAAAENSWTNFRREFREKYFSALKPEVRNVTAG
jgi:glycosyltransferase involved in cell wall biosynthesis